MMVGMAVGEGLATNPGDWHCVLNEDILLCYYYINLNVSICPKILNKVFLLLDPSTLFNTPFKGCKEVYLWLNNQHNIHQVFKFEPKTNFPKLMSKLRIQNVNKLKL